jgi:hypothetical protein
LMPPNVGDLAPRNPSFLPLEDMLALAQRHGVELLGPVPSIT